MEVLQTQVAPRGIFMYTARLTLDRGTRLVVVADICGVICSMMSARVVVAVVHQMSTAVKKGVNLQTFS